MFTSKPRLKTESGISRVGTAAMLTLTFALAGCAQQGSNADVERLMAIQDIEQLRARFVNAIDMRNWNELRDEILAPDLVLDVPARVGDKSAEPDARKRVEGSDAFVTFARGVAGDKPGGNHSVTNPVFTFTSDTTAEVIWRLGTASYFDSYEKSNGQWRIKSIRFEPNIPGPQPPPPSQPE